MTISIFFNFLFVWVKKIPNVAYNNVDRPDGGFYIKPEIGYHNRDWNFFVQYNKTFTGDKGEIGDQKYNAGAIGVGFGYNIPLGK